MKSKIVSVVVTYNRKKLLIECLSAIYAQSFQPNQVILIDNASTDGTEEELSKAGFLHKNNFIYIKMESNIGGAGGFYEGIKHALLLECDWVWIMDDDTIPEKHCLENMLIAYQKVNDKVSFLASCVEGSQREPMNVPKLDERTTENGYCDWYKHLEFKLVKIENATFVSILINVDAIKKCGLPCKEYFIWGDDSEYTLRLSRNYGNAYLVGDSKVCHKRKIARYLKIENETEKGRIDNYFYHYRNGLVNSFLYYGVLYGLALIAYNFLHAIMAIKYPLGLRKSKIILKGTLSGICQYSYFNKYIGKELKGYKVTQK